MKFYFTGHFIHKMSIISIFITDYPQQRSLDLEKAVVHFRLIFFNKNMCFVSLWSPRLYTVFSNLGKIFVMSLAHFLSLPVALMVVQDSLRQLCLRPDRPMMFFSSSSR